jgi:hypothetical protein
MSDRQRPSEPPPHCYYCGVAHRNRCGEPDDPRRPEATPVPLREAWDRLRTEIATRVPNHLKSTQFYEALNDVEGGVREVERGTGDAQEPAEGWSTSWWPGAGYQAKGPPRRTLEEARADMPRRESPKPVPLATRCVERWGGGEAGSRCKKSQGHTGGHSWEPEAAPNACAEWARRLADADSRLDWREVNEVRREMLAPPLRVAMPDLTPLKADTYEFRAADRPCVDPMKERVRVIVDGLERQLLALASDAFVEGGATVDDDAHSSSDESGPDGYRRALDQAMGRVSEMHAKDPRTVYRVACGDVLMMLAGMYDRATEKGCKPDV